MGLILEEHPSESPVSDVEENVADRACLTAGNSTRAGGVQLHPWHMSFLADQTSYCLSDVEEAKTKTLARPCCAKTSTTGQWSAESIQAAADSGMEALL